MSTQQNTSSHEFHRRSHDALQRALGAAILAALADEVNADAGSLYAADVVAGEIRLFRSGDAAFSASLSVSPAGVPAVDAATARTTLVSLVGNPVVGEVWTLSFGGQSYAVTVTGAMASLADVAQGLAALQ